MYQTHNNPAQLLHKQTHLTINKQITINQARNTPNHLITTTHNMTHHEQHKIHNLPAINPQILNKILNKLQ